LTGLIQDLAVISKLISRKCPYPAVDEFTFLRREGKTNCVISGSSATNLSGAEINCSSNFSASSRFGYTILNVSSLKQER
jgi:hypothetical protein